MDERCVGLIAFIFFTFSVVPSRPCQTRKEEKISCRCFQQREVNEVCLKLLAIYILKEKFETNGRYTPYYFAGGKEIRNLIIGHFLLLLYVIYYVTLYVY